MNKIKKKLCFAVLEDGRANEALTDSMQREMKVKEKL